MLRRRHFAFYLRKTLGSLGKGKKRKVERLRHFSQRWRQELMYNQLWTFASVNILLVDRLLVANLYRDQIHQYVFFANIFNLVNVAHSLFYFVPRRPELIRDKDATAWGEIFRPGNLFPPLLYLAVSMIIAIAVRYSTPIYESVSPRLFGGLALFYLLQAVNLVGIEYVFWRVSRLRLLVCDGALVIAMGAAIYWLAPAIEWIPYITSAGLLVRMIAYQWIARSAVARSQV